VRRYRHGELRSERSFTVIPAVGDLAIFAGCGRAQLALVESLLTAILLPAGAELIRAGVPAREFAVIADGEVAVTDAGGHEVAVLGAGEIVGELGLLRDDITGADVTTLTPVVAYVGNRREFASLLGVAPAIDHRVTRTALSRLRAS
jgi:CRP-like cAMP-binding protein